MPQSLATRALHADHAYVTNEVGPAISTTTTFRQTLGEDESNWDPYDPAFHIYARESRPAVTRVEKVLESVLGGPTALFPSGIAAAFTALHHCRPDVIAITEGYPGCHHAIRLYRKTRGEDAVKVIALDDEYPAKSEGKSLLVWVETPLNPSGQCRSIEHYANRAHNSGGQVLVDSTFGPPGIQDPFAWGADIIMHSASKYLLGHSDALAGTLSVKTKEEWLSLYDWRTYSGSNVGSLETWLLLRSIKTMAIRVESQFKTATKLAAWLASISRVHGKGDAQDGPTGIIDDVWHASLREDASTFIGEGKQMSAGSACFSFVMVDPKHAELIGHNLDLFTPAASLGGVESLIEQRCLAAPSADPRIVRISIGLESFEDLKADLIAGFEKVKSASAA